MGELLKIVLESTMPEISITTASPLIQGLIPPIPPSMISTFELTTLLPNSVRVITLVIGCRCEYLNFSTGRNRYRWG